MIHISTTPERTDIDDNDPTVPIQAEELAELLRHDRATVPAPPLDLLTEFLTDGLVRRAR
jgi:hypothetical protein